jgi:hypothetical protein
VTQTEPSLTIVGCLLIAAGIVAFVALTLDGP